MMDKKFFKRYEKLERLINKYVDLGNSIVAQTGGDRSFAENWRVHEASLILREVVKNEPDIADGVEARRIALVACEEKCQRYMFLLNLEVKRFERLLRKKQGK